MLGWILYKEPEDIYKPEYYEIQRIVEVATLHNIEIKVLKPEQIEIIVFKEGRKTILVDNITTSLPEFVIPRMGAKTSYFAFAVIRHLERLGVFSLNSSQSIDAVKDKLYTHQILSESHLPIPKTILLKFPVDPSLVEKHLSFPVVVKTLSGTQGSGVYLSKDRNSFDDLMQLIQTTNKSANLILQEYIKESHGTDLRVLMVGNKLISVMKRTSANNNFKANYSIGGQVTKFEVTAEIEKLSKQIMEALNLDFAGIDLLFDKNGLKICEVNSSPGFEGMESCCNVNVAEEIIRYVKNKVALRQLAEICNFYF